MPRISRFSRPVVPAPLKPERVFGLLVWRHQFPRLIVRDLIEASKNGRRWRRRVRARYSVQIFESLGLVQLQSAVFLPPAVERLHGVIWASRQACGVVFPLANSTSICRSSVTICSGLYRFMGIPAFLQSEFSLTPAGTKIPGQVRAS